MDFAWLIFCPGINARQQWFLYLSSSVSVDCMASQRHCLRKSIIVRPRRIRKWPSSDTRHCKSTAQQSHSFIVLMRSALLHICAWKRNVYYVCHTMAMENYSPPDCNGNQCLIVWYEFNWIIIIENKGKQWQRFMVNIYWDGLWQQPKEYKRVHRQPQRQMRTLTIKRWLQMAVMGTDLWALLSCMPCTMRYATTMSASSRDSDGIFFHLDSFIFTFIPGVWTMWPAYQIKENLRRSRKRATRLRYWTQSKLMCADFGTRAEKIAWNTKLWKVFSLLFFVFFFSFNFGFKHFCHPHTDRENRLKWTAMKLSYILFIKLFPSSLCSCFLLRFLFSFSSGVPVVPKSKCWAQREWSEREYIAFRLSVNCLVVDWMRLMLLLLWKIANHLMSRMDGAKNVCMHAKGRETDGMKKRGNKPKTLGQWWWSMVDWIQMKVISLNRQISLYTYSVPVSLSISSMCW